MNDVLMIDVCYSCNDVFVSCPECVNVLRVDPLTGLPPDVELVYGRPMAITPVPGAVERSVKASLCDPCVIRVNQRSPGKFPMTWAERHDRHHR